MKAGKLDKTITIERFTSTVDDFGTSVEAWTPLASRRAQLIQSNMEEFIRAYGATDDTIAIFKIRFLDGLTNADRVTYAGRTFDLKEIKELGRREGQELRCVASGA